MLPEAGHVFPTLKLARSLVQKGHEVRYGAPPYLHGFFRKQGFSSFTIFADLLTVTTRNQPLWNHSETIFRDRLREYLEANAASFTEFLAAKLRHQEFDTLICDYVIMKYCNATLAEQLQKTVVVLSTSLPEDEVEDLGGPLLVLCPYELEIPSARPLTASRQPLMYAEPSVFYERKDHDFCWNELSLERRLVYCSFGTQSAQYPQVSSLLHGIVDAFADLPSYQLVVSTGRDAVKPEVRPLPGNVILASDVPQLRILDCSDLFISHGGLGGLKESILAGVPALILPFDHDQPRNAMRIVYHNLGRACAPSDCTPALIRELVKDVLRNDRTFASVKRMRSIFWKRERCAPAARFLERVAAHLPV